MPSHPDDRLLLTNLLKISTRKKIHHIWCNFYHKPLPFQGGDPCYMCDEFWLKYPYDENNPDPEASLGPKHFPNAERLSR